MIVVALLVLLLAFVSFYSFFEDDDTPPNVWVIAGIVTFMVLLAGLRPIGLDADSETYQAYFTHPDTAEGVEESFLMLSRLLLPYFDTVQPVFFIYALLSVPIMALAIRRISKLFLLSLTVWVGHYYVLHDMTQIRVGLALAIVFWGIYFLSEGKRLAYVAAVIAGTFFHISAALFLLFTFVGNGELNRYWRWGLVVVPTFCYALGLMHIDLIPMLPFDYVQDKIDAYETMRDIGTMGETLNLLKPVYLIRLLAYYMLLWKYDLLKEHLGPYAFCLKMFAFSFVLFTVFSSLPAVAYRLFDLFGVIEILLVPTLAYAFKPSAIGRSFVVVFASAYLFSMISTFEL